ncbi:MAG: class I SAM-dependent methyltransferase, partial [Dehalococcoidia bacterium]|nr:class I SAM-dependent methyltransferase [Dehalococcoidia bacterium]
MRGDRPATITIEDVVRSFDGHVGYYAHAALTLGLWASERATFARYLPRDGRILDIGCGAGRTTFGLFEMGFTDLEGYDLHEQMIARARALADSLDYPIPFTVGDARAMPYADSSFAAAIFSFNGLMQTPRRSDRRVILTEIRRVLAPNGVFVFTTHDRDAEPRWRGFWRDEHARWRSGQRDPRLHEFGDRVIQGHD